MSTIHTLFIAKQGVKNLISGRPLCVSFEVTHACNAHCKHCHLGGSVDEERADPERFGEICRLLQPVVIQVSGGEPLLRKDVEQIVKVLRVPNRAPYVVFCTNAALLTREKFYSLRNAGVNEFSISLDYPDERHDEFRHIPGLFRKLEKLARELNSKDGMAITLSCVVQRDNFRELLKIAEVALGWNLRINFSTYTWMRTKDKAYMLTKEDLPELRTIIDRLLDLKQNNKRFFTSKYILNQMYEFFEKGGIPNCRAGERFFVVNPDATFSPCGLIMKNYKTQQDLLENFTKKNACGNCITSSRANSERPVRYMLSDSLYKTN